MRRRRAFVTCVLVIVVLLGGLTVRWAPALTLAAALAIPSVDPWFGAVLSRVDREEITLDARGHQLRADLYRPPRPHAGIVLVHGLSRAGRRHPELVRFARLLAQHGEVVLVPELDGLVAFRLSGNEVEEITAAARYVATLTDSLGVVGFSFGAGPALLAAADLPAVDVVASFGGYADLQRVIAYITTGVHSYRGARHVQRQQEYNRWKLMAVLAGFVENDRDARILETIAARRLADPGAETRALEDDLGVPGQAILAVVLNRREDAVDALVAALPTSVRQAFDRLSPLGTIARISGRLLIAHGMEDDSIPFTESLRLADAAGGRARVALFHTFHHTGPEPVWRSFADRARDGFNVVRLADELLVSRRHRGR